MEEKRFKNYDKKDRSTGRKNFSDNQGKSFNRPRQNRDDSKGRENHSRTYFLDRMQEKLNDKMRKDDELERMRR